MVIHIQAHQYMKTKSNLERQYNNAQDKLKWFAKSDKTGTDLVRRSVTVIMLLQTFHWTCISTFASTPNKSYTGQLSAPGNIRISIH